VQRERSAARLTILPLNGGDAVYTEGRGAGGELLIDCGSESTAEFVTQAVPGRAGESTDWGSGVVTRGHPARRGAGFVLDRFSTRQVLASGARFRSPSYRELFDRLQKHAGSRPVDSPGDLAGPWTVLHPTRDDRFSKHDDAATVLRGEFAGTRVLLLSDWASRDKNALLDREGDLPSGHRSQRTTGEN